MGRDWQYGRSISKSRTRDRAASLDGKTRAWKDTPHMGPAVNGRNENEDWLAWSIGEKWDFFLPNFIFQIRYAFCPISRSFFPSHLTYAAFSASEYKIVKFDFKIRPTDTFIFVIPKLRSNVNLSWVCLSGIYSFLSKHIPLRDKRREKIRKFPMKYLIGLIKMAITLFTDNAND